MFKQAVKTEAKLRLAIAGPSGSGKTYTALAIATNLGERVAVVDTEHGSASKYADIFNFDTVEMHSPFMPQKYMEAIKAAVELGYNVLVMDSMSHAWNGSGGMLEMVEKASKRYSGNSYAAWGDVTPIYQQMIEAIVSADLHIICTMRSKQDYVLVETSNGKTRPQKVGMAPIQRDGFEYEFDVFLDMDIENNGIIQKTRCPALTGQVFNKPGADIADILKDWLSGEPAPAPEKAKPRRTTPHETVTSDEFMEEFDREMGAKHDPMGSGYEPEQKPEPKAPKKQPAAKNGNGKAPDPLADLRGRFHDMGKKLWPDNWDEKRAIMVADATNGKSESSSDLNEEQLTQLISEMAKMLNERLASK